MKSLLSVSFQFLLLFILVAMFHKTVVFKYLLVLDRSFMARGLSDCVLVGAICCPRWRVGIQVLFWNPQLSVPEGFLRLLTFSRRRNPLICCQLAERRLRLGLLGYRFAELWQPSWRRELVVSPFCALSLT